MVSRHIYSILANRKRELGIAFESGRRLGHELAFVHGIDQHEAARGCANQIVSSV
ncbi:hypothetical protein [Bradyrhizobium sp. ARR65]|uniref:hypothetical protein n=1 Tax=Bradyrhizobium sp. ARR65 TaxID=1040989 RepID=UPI000AD610F8|nr:hypothetical protein [Bradyrhizobium sp. ARR65]